MVRSLNDLAVRCSPQVQETGVQCLLLMRHRIFWITIFHYFHTLLNLMANEIEMHESMLSPWTGELDRGQVVRGWGSIPS